MGDFWIHTVYAVAMKTSVANSTESMYLNNFYHKYVSGNVVNCFAAPLRTQDLPDKENKAAKASITVKTITDVRCKVRITKADFVVLPCKNHQSIRFFLSLKSTS